MPIVRLTGDYFELTDRLPMAARPRAAARSVLVISVAKRIVRSAVRRNTVRRVVRESWRAALAASPAQPGRHWLIRLRAHPVPKSPSPDRSGRDRPGHDRPVPGFAAVKRLLRADADHLFGQALTSRPRRPRTVHFSPVGRDPVSDRPVDRDPIDREVPEGPVR